MFTASRKQTQVPGPGKWINDAPITDNLTQPLSRIPRELLYHMEKCLHTHWRQSIHTGLNTAYDPRKAQTKQQRKEGSSSRHSEIFSDNWKHVISFHFLNLANFYNKNGWGK